MKRNRDCSLGAGCRGYKPSRKEHRARGKAAPRKIIVAFPAEICNTVPVTKVEHGPFLEKLDCFSPSKTRGLLKYGSRAHIAAGWFAALLDLKKTGRFASQLTEKGTDGHEKQGNPGNGRILDCAIRLRPGRIRVKLLLTCESNQEAALPYQSG
jgi:hypothetical protein